MRKALGFTFVAILALALSGCFIQSFQPFYTKANVVELPAALGNWYLVEQGGEVVATDYPEPWVFGKEQVTTFSDNVSSQLDLTYFKVNKNHFIDFYPAEDQAGINNWWQMHTVPVHSVCKVVFSDGKMSLIPLDGDWVEFMLEEKSPELSALTINEEEEHTVLTSSSEELVALLEKHGDNSEAFPTENEYRFQRQKHK